jgi:RNA polymerase-binding transcription factor DksA
MGLEMEAAGRRAMTGIEIEARRRLLDARRALKTREASALGTAEGRELQREIREVEDALGRLDAGVFGTCEVCAAPIGGQRLRAIPEARRCSACAKAVT